MSKNENLEKWSDLRVGAIVLIAILLIVFGVSFAGGDKGLLFQKRSVVKALLPNVGGLKSGSAVTMGGMNIGRVTHLQFAEASARQVEVVMEVRQDVRSKIKTDSTPSVKTQGMLGDRYIDIAPGSETAQTLTDGGHLIGESATAFDDT